MIFICDIIIYPLIKKNKFNCVFLSLNIVIVSKNLKSLQTMCLYRTKKSTNILGVSVLGAGPVGTQSVQTGWNPSEPVQINPFEPVETRYNPFRPVGTRFQPTQWIFLFYIFIFLYFYTSPPPPPSPPISPYSFFFFWGGGGGRGRGRGRGRRRHRGGATTTAGRSPLRRGGDKVPPPSPSNKKQNLQIKRHMYSRE